MAFLEFKNVRIAGIAAGVPENVVSNYTLKSGEDISADYTPEAFVETTGVKERRCSETLTTSDLCFAAAEKLISDLGWDKKEIEALVIDVRGNSGGYLSTVTDIASLILPKGEIIYQMQKDNKKTATKDKTSDKLTYSIAILVDGGSASASEILAGVIKESYHGYVVGTKTFGKGTVQQVKKLSDGSMIKYTTQNWLTPNGNWIDGVGIEPTDKVELDSKYVQDPKDENDNQLQKALELVSK